MALPGVREVQIELSQMTELERLRLLGGVSEPEAGHIQRLGIAVVSSSLPLAEEEDAAFWRGALLARAIRRFWFDVRCWPLDDLLVDLPPGGSDEAFTVAESLPLSGLVFVTTPHDSVARVRRSLLMARRLGVRVLGVVENMTHLDCPDTGRRHEPFGPGHGQDLAREAEAPLVARLPLDPVLTRFSDEGRIEEYVSDETRSMTQALIIELAVAATDAAGAAAMTPA